MNIIYTIYIHILCREYAIKCYLYHVKRTKFSRNNSYFGGIYARGENEGQVSGKAQEFGRRDICFTTRESFPVGSSLHPSRGWRTTNKYSASQRENKQYRRTRTSVRHRKSSVWIGDDNTLPCHYKMISPLSRPPRRITRITIIMNDISKGRYQARRARRKTVKSPSPRKTKTTLFDNDFSGGPARRSRGTPRSTAFGPRGIRVQEGSRGRGHRGNPCGHTDGFTGLRHGITG